MVNYFPKTINEAIGILNKEKVKIIGGGTDLMVKYRQDAGIPPSFACPLMFTNRLLELKSISIGKNAMKIGAGATLKHLIEFNGTPEVFKGILLQMASRAIRNEATLAGNIANASPAGDTLPFLYAVDAVIKVISINEEKEIPIREFITGPGHTVLNGNEIISEIKFHIPKITHYKYRKAGGRQSDAISKLSFLGTANKSNGIIEDIRIAFGSVAPTVIRNINIESKLRDAINANSEEDINKSIEEYNTLIRPIDDQRSRAEYRRQCSVNLLNGFIAMICCG